MLGWSKEADDLGALAKMNDGMLELVRKIMHAVTFIAVGGTLALIFIAIFAPSIFGSRTIHKQLEGLHGQIEKTNELLKRIAQALVDRSEGPKKGP
jgi:hypothetical protein